MSDSNEDVKVSPLHIWGDETFDWKALNDACIYMESKCRRYARLGIHTKEKYGTMRVSTTCAYFMEHDFLHHFVNPGYYRYTWPKWFRTSIDWPIGKVMRRLGVIRILQKWQHLVLKHFWKKAAKKWPHISEEILDEYEWEVGEKP